MRKITMLPAECVKHGDHWQAGCFDCAMAQRVRAWDKPAWQPSVRYSVLLLLLVLAIIAAFEWRF